MKKISCLIVVFVLALLTACGQGIQTNEVEASPEPEIQEIIEEENDALYEIEVDGIHGLLSVVQYGDNRAYILGSMHVGREDWYPLTSAAEAAMNRADVFAFEIDMSSDGGPCLCDEYCDCDCDPDANDCMCLLMEMMFFPEGEDLLTFLPAEDYKRFMANLRTFPVNLDVISTFRPTTIVEMVLYLIVAPELGFSSDLSVDNYVFNRAEELDRPIIGLTDTIDHINFISGMPDEYQFATARYFSNLETMLEETNELALVYETQDIETLRLMVRSGLAIAYAEYEAGELSAGGLGLARYWHYTVGNYRSNFFARQIADLLTQTEEPTTFFVTVGIAHLAREENVFDALRDMGFTVERLH
ncbi:MAG: TraB/GumN family protein [Defluviitaleaceae bacterium]|nr:TraB/GumN family protein [Defluviitaleaceae bacterium]